MLGCKGLNTTVVYVVGAVHREGYDGLFKRHSNFEFFDHSLELQLAVKNQLL